MTDINTQALKKSFHQEIIDLYKKIVKIVKYKPTRLMDYINKYGGYEAAVKYITTESNVQDFAVLWESERLDLSVEALITCEKYRPIFNEDVLTYCDRKLKEYSYAPNKIEEVKETSGYIDEEEEKETKINIEEFLRQKERMIPKTIKKDFKMYHQAVPISKEQWKALLLDTKVVTAGNLEFLLRVYSIGDEVGPIELGKEKGLSSKYPYKEVMMALGKRIKTALQIEVPSGEDKKPLWWHLIFNGGFKDNNCFEWSLKKDLREALNELIEEGKVEQVEVVTKKPLVEIVEEQPQQEVSETDATDALDNMSAFDRLFASIIETPSKKPTEIKEQKSVQEKVNSKEVVPTPVIEDDTVVNTVVNKVEEVEEIRSLSTEETTYPSKEKSEAAIKKACLEYYGAICDLCGFDYGYTYGENYENLIEVHNIKESEGAEIRPDTDPVKDLVPICCNCHQVIHSQKPAISIEKMREIIKVSY